MSLETYPSSTEFNGIAIPIYINGFCLYIYSLQTSFHYCELIFSNIYIFYASFSVPPSAFEIVCAITSLALLETPLPTHPIIMFVFSYDIIFMSVDYLLINSYNLIFFVCCFQLISFSHLQQKFLLLNSWHCRQHCYIYHFYYFCTLGHLVPAAGYSDVHLYSQHLAPCVISQFCSLISNGPGSLMETVNVLCHYRILCPKGALGKLFFYQT